MLLLMLHIDKRTPYLLLPTSLERSRRRRRLLLLLLLLLLLQLLLLLLLLLVVLVVVVLVVLLLVPLLLLQLVLLLQLILLLLLLISLLLLLELVFLLLLLRVRLLLLVRAEVRHDSRLGLVAWRRMLHDVGRERHGPSRRAEHGHHLRVHRGWPHGDGLLLRKEGGHRQRQGGQGRRRRRLGSLRLPSPLPRQGRWQAFVQAVLLLVIL